VFISSHDLDEVERLVDTVAFIDAGRLVLCEPFADLQARFRRIEATTDAADPQPSATPDSWIGLRQAGRVVRFVETRYVEGETERRAGERFSAAAIDVQPMTLREIFVAIVRERREAR